ncbi:MAG TPA: hypothetical protein VN514_02645 [Ignavibacteria bacterium]|nr:hypothetical protein [Ignavibacteria bacterium]
MTLILADNGFILTVLIFILTDLGFVLADIGFILTVLTFILTVLTFITGDEIFFRCNESFITSDRDRVTGEEVCITDAALQAPVTRATSSMTGLFFMGMSSPSAVIKVFSAVTEDKI